MTQIEAGREIAGKYRLERILAQGGMGSIWIARQIQLDRSVAIKFMDVGLSSAADGRARFEREAKASAQIQSPHVVQIHDYGIEGNVPYIVMELLEGEDLATRLRKQRRISVSAMAAILVPVAKALRKAHEAGIIHRDLKPANIFIAKTDEDEVVKILDFGIAKVSGVGVASEATATGVLVGSVHYMSPEQARGMKTVDGRSDLWSLAVITFRALTGRVPFPGDQLGDVIVRICSDDVPKASSIVPDLGPEVDNFFERALSRDPEKRFPTAPEMAQAFLSLAESLGPAAGGPVMRKMTLSTGLLPPVPSSRPSALAMPASPPKAPLAPSSAPRSAPGAPASRPPPRMRTGTLLPSGGALPPAPPLPTPLPPPPISSTNAPTPAPSSGPMATPPPISPSRSALSGTSPSTPAPFSPPRPPVTASSAVTPAPSSPSRSPMGASFVPEPAGQLRASFVPTTAPTPQRLDVALPAPPAMVVAPPAMVVAPPPIVEAQRPSSESEPPPDSDDAFEGATRVKLTAPSTLQELLAEYPMLDDPTMDVEATADVTQKQVAKDAQPAAAPPVLAETPPVLAAAPPAPEPPSLEDEDEDMEGRTRVKLEPSEALQALLASAPSARGAPSSSPAAESSPAKQPPASPLEISSSSWPTPPPASASLYTPGPIAGPASSAPAIHEKQPADGSPAGASLDEVLSEPNEYVELERARAARRRKLTFGALALLVVGTLVVVFMNGRSEQPSSTTDGASPPVSAAPASPQATTETAPPSIAAATVEPSQAVNAAVPEPSAAPSAAPTAGTHPSAAPSASSSADPGKKKPVRVPKPKLNETLGI